MEKNKALKAIRDCEIEFITDGSLENEPYVLMSSLRKLLIEWLDALEEKGNKEDSFTFNKFTWGRGKLKYSAEAFIQDVLIP